MLKAEELPSPLFSSPYLQGRLTLASGGNPPRLFVLSKRTGSLVQVDPKTGQGVLRLAGIPHPEDLNVGSRGQRILISLDSSRSLWVLPVAAGPPLSLTVGLNPGQIVRNADGQLYLTARAVHILYHLNPDSDRPDRWTAMGDIFSLISSDSKGDLWLPLARGEQVADLDPKNLEHRRIYDLDSCGEPSRVLPLPSGGFVVGCRNALLLADSNGEKVARLPLRGRLSRGVQDMVLLPGKNRLLVAFRKCKILNLYHLPDLSRISSFRFSYLPVRLYYFKKWPTLFLVMDDPDNDRTRLSGYPLSAFGRTSLPLLRESLSPSGPATLLPGATPSTSSPRTHP